MHNPIERETEGVRTEVKKLRLMEGEEQEEGRKAEQRRGAAERGFSKRGRQLWCEVFSMRNCSEARTPRRKDADMDGRWKDTELRMK